MKKYIVLILIILVFFIYFQYKTTCKKYNLDSDLELFSNTNNLLISDNNGNMNATNYPKFPVGIILAWSGSFSTIPDGWLICDGKNSTPDLRGRFVIGVGTSNSTDIYGNTLTTRNLGDMDGYETVALDITQMPSHNHPYQYNDPKGSRGSYSGDYWGPSTVSSTTENATNSDGEANGSPHQNMHPYYTLYYIIYTGSISNNLLSCDSNKEISLIQYPLFKIGIVILWNGTIDTIPLGWSLCDGTVSNGYTTPDLRGRSILGAGFGGTDKKGNPLTTRNIGDKGGVEKYALKITELPKHTHNYTYKEPLTLNDSSYSTWTYVPSNVYDYTSNTGGDSDGNTVPHENMPPFNSLCYICYTGTTNNLFISNVNGDLITINYPLFPIGIVIAWNGPISKLTSEWALCDGNVYKGYTTPDLRSRFVIGIGSGGTDENGISLTSRNLGDMDGYETVALDITQIPSHHHRFMHRNSMSTGNQDYYGSKSFYTHWSQSVASSITTLTGGDLPHENMPPFYALYYICYVGF